MRPVRLKQITENQKKEKKLKDTKMRPRLRAAALFVKNPL